MRGARELADHAAEPLASPGAVSELAPGPGERPGAVHAHGELVKEAEPAHTATLLPPAVLETRVFAAMHMRTHIIAAGVARERHGPATRLDGRSLGEVPSKEKNAVRIVMMSMPKSGK